MQLNGIYGLVSLNGSPLLREDCAVLGLNAEAGSFAGRAFDCILPQMVERVEHGEDIALFLGRLNDPETLSQTLDVADASAGELALAAFNRWGAEMQAHVPGSWAIALWRGEQKILEITTSHLSRDQIYYAYNGKQVAIAPSLATLAALSWVDDSIDSIGLATMFGNPRLTIKLPRATHVKSVSKLGSGCYARFDKDGLQLRERAALKLRPWQGDFEDAVEAATDAVRQIVRREIAPHKHIGVFLSGGLDSTTLAWLASEEVGSHQTLTAFCSVAPEGSGLQDDWKWAKIVADQLGIELVPVCPRPDAQFYQPDPRNFIRFNGFSARHYLYDAFYNSAVERGIGVMLDGLIGEISITGNTRMISSRNIPGVMKGALLDWWQSRIEREDDWTTVALGIKPHSDWAETLPDQFKTFRNYQTGAEWHWPKRARGLPRMSPALGQQGTATFLPQLRTAPCLTDPELICLTSGMPANFFRWKGQGRSLVRAMLKGAISDDIRLRGKGGEFSPDYLQRLVSETPHLIKRVEQYSAAGVDKYVDLNWLERQAKSMNWDRAATMGHGRTYQNSNQACEYLLWWLNHTK